MVKHEIKTNLDGKITTEKETQIMNNNFKDDFVTATSVNQSQGSKVQDLVDNAKTTTQENLPETQEVKLISKEKSSIKDFVLKNWFASSLALIVLSVIVRHGIIPLILNRFD